jgi:hypothetical protein
MSSVPSRKPQAAAAPRPRPVCACGRGPVPPMSGVCATCAHDNAAAFWRLMGLPGIPTELPKVPGAEPEPAPIPRRKSRRH